MTDPRWTRRRLLAVTGAGAALGGLLPAGRAGESSVPARATDFARAVLAGFDRHRLVALGEAHGQQEHGDALQLLLADPRLPEVLDDVVVEFGNARYQPVVDRFVAGGAVDDAVLRQVWRDTTQSPAGTGDQPIREQFFRTVRAVNWTLPPQRRIRVLLGDPPIDWSKISTQAQVDTFLEQRDAHVAALVEREVLSKGRRALICYGSGHVLHASADHAVSLIEEHTGRRVHVIVSGTHPRLAGQPRRTVIPCAGTWLASVDAGQFMDAPPLCGTPLGKVADAVLYLGQRSELTRSLWNPAIFLDPVYWAELRRRNAINGNHLDLEQYRQPQPIGWSTGSPGHCG
ncbi:hypothetical protein ACIBO5_54130 [Nonomuraea angiospora]|uniref:hypothetical protein n=1 Tax=Nonomuraea angiospora TaxID=46172 RepID=UPI0037894B72